MVETMWIFRPAKLHQKKFEETTWIFRPLKRHQKKIRGNNLDFLTIEITSKKVRVNDVDFSISEITLKKYVEMTLKFVEIWSSSYRRNTDETRPGIDMVYPLGYSSSTKIRRHQNVF